MSSKVDVAPRAPRFEASLGPVPRGKAIGLAAELDLDRLPDVDGKVRLLLSATDAQKLLDRGIEVRLVKAVPVKPLDPKLVMSDAQAKRDAESQLQGLRRGTGKSPGPKGGQ